MRFPFFRNRDSVKNGILISIRRTGDGFHPGLFIKHTSNSLEYLNFFSKNYAGQSSYVCSNSVLDRNLVTASSAGSLEWTKNILKSLNVYSDKKITAFYNYYSTGNVKYYDELLK